VRFADRDGRAPEDVQRAFRAAFGKPGGLDFASVSAFNAQLLKRLNKQGPLSVKLGIVIGKIAADPEKAARAGFATLTERLGAKPLVSINLTKTNDGFKLSEVKVSPTLGFKEFTIKKKK
jgi:hypothetical protein